MKGLKYIIPQVPASSETSSYSKKKRSEAKLSFCEAANRGAEALRGHFLPRSIRVLGIRNVLLQELVAWERVGSSELPRAPEQQDVGVGP